MEIQAMKNNPVVVTIQPKEIRKIYTGMLCKIFVRDTQSNSLRTDYRVKGSSVPDFEATETYLPCMDYYTEWSFTGEMDIYIKNVGNLPASMVLMS